MQKSHRKDGGSRRLRGLVFGGVEVEVCFVESFFSFPIADYVLNTVLFVGRSGQEVALMVKQKLTLFVCIIKRAFSAIKPFDVFKF